VSIEKILQNECHKRSLTLNNFCYSRPSTRGSVNAYEILAQGPTNSSVLFVHGFGNDSLFPQIPFLLKLAEEGHTVFTFDLDGHGIHSTTLLIPDEMLSSIKDAVLQIKERGFTGKLHLIGHSLGALLSLHASVRDELALSSLTLISMATDMRFTRSVLLREAFSSIFTGSFFRILKFYKTDFIPALGPIGRSRFPIRTEKKRDESVRDLVRFLKHLMRNPVYARVRTLYCYGTRDILTPLQEDKLRISESDTLLMLKGETHLTTISSSLLSQEVCKWLEK